VWNTCPEGAWMTRELPSKDGKGDGGVPHSRVARARSALSSRQLRHYPSNSRRMLYLGIVVVTTIMLYYELYVQSAVSASIIRDYGMSFKYFIYIVVAASMVGAFASFAGGLADRRGRANLVVYSTLGSALLVLLGLPHAPDKWSYLAMLCAVN